MKFCEDFTAPARVFSWLKAWWQFYISDTMLNGCLRTVLLGPSRGLSYDCEIFANHRLKLLIRCCNTINGNIEMLHSSQLYNTTPGDQRPWHLNLFLQRITFSPRFTLHSHSTIDKSICQEFLLQPQFCVWIWIEGYLKEDESPPGRSVAHAF